MHPLQTTFATAEGESAWCDNLRTLIEQARFAEAEEVLAEALTDLDTEMGRLCQATSAASVTISGWPELAERIELHEGDEPVSGLTIAIGNDGDLDFEKGRMLTPYMMLGLYTDEEWSWSNATREVLLAECASEVPAWAGYDEDIEAFVEISGLDALNTALIHSKQRHFIREGDEQEAPLRYVEYIVGCWVRALRFHQAVAAAEAEAPLPGALTIVSGMVDMRPDVVAVHLPERAVVAPAVSVPLEAETPPVEVVEAPAPTDHSAVAEDDDLREVALTGEAEAVVSVAPAAVATNEAEAAPEVEPAVELGENRPFAVAEAEGADETGEDEEAEAEGPSLELISRNLITRRPIVEEKPVSGADLRRRITVEAANDAGAPRRSGFIARLFGRA